MADWGPWVGDRTSNQSIIYGISPGATAHTKGAWLAGGASARAEGVYFSVNYLRENLASRTLFVDVGFGSPEQIVINNLMLCPPAVGGSSTARSVEQVFYFPVHMPSGNSIKARAQSSIASHDTIFITPHRMLSGLPCAGSVVDTYGANTASTRGTVITSDTGDGVFGGWFEISSSCKRIKALLIAVGHGNQAWTTFAYQWYAIHIGIGPSSSEQTVLSIQDAGASSSSTGTVSQMFLGPFYLDIPEGSRVSARVAKQYASSSQRTIDVVLYGIR